MNEIAVRVYGSSDENFFDRRLRPRLKIDIPVTIDIYDANRAIVDSVLGKVRDIGGNGISILLPSALLKDQLVRIHFVLDSDNSLFESYGIVNWSLLKTKSEWEHGIQFFETPPEARKILSTWLSTKFRDIGAIEDRRIRASIKSTRIEFLNRSGRRIVGTVDETNNLPLDACVVILPPAYGETKINNITASFFLANNGFRAIRYDATDHVGESEGEMLDCRMRNMSDDILSVIDYVCATFHPPKIGMVATSLAARAAIKAVSEDLRVSMLVTLVGVVDLQASIKAVYHEDMIGTCMGGRKWDITEVLGFPVRGKFLETAIEDNFHNLPTTIADLRKIKGKVVEFVTENDLWVDCRDVQRTTQLPNVEMVMIAEGFHQLHENRAVARKALRSVTHKLLEELVAPSATLEMVKNASYREIGLRVRFERERIRNLANPNCEAEKAFWEKYLDGFDIVLRSDEFQDLYRLIVQSLGGLDRRCLLDVGCGNGNFGIWLLRYLAGQNGKRHLFRRNVDENIRYIGMDYVELALLKADKSFDQTWARLRREKLYPNMHWSFVRGDASRELPFCQGQFNAVVCNLLISYVDDPLFTLRQQYRVLKPGGKLVVTSLKPDPDLSVIFDQFAKKTSGQELDAARALLNNAGGIRYREAQGQFRFFAEEELTNLLNASGFVNVRTSAVLANQAVMAAGEKR
jgi:ubiquinone/menaquinone biosynthesis C-methylase UbiE